jgi:hypothetical protein
MPKKLTKEEFIKKSREKHGYKYNYDKVEYVNNRTKVCIICPEHGHGEFWQTPGHHIRGVGCPKCGGNCTLTKEEWVATANEVHEGKYDYSKVKYKNNSTKVCIICKKHGEFWQRPSFHIRGCACPKCSADKTRERLTSTKEEFVEKACKVHDDKYDYSRVNYVNSTSKVCIICREHGEFWQTPSQHLMGDGCPKCGGCYVPSTEEWITSARKVHGNKYDYSKVKYVNARTKVCIICKKHGEFWQIPSNHTKGTGCPKCGKIAAADINRLSKEEFIKMVNEVHHGKYNYDKIKYVNDNTKVCIICPEHGEFWQRPHDHKRGIGCSKCGNNIPSTEEWIVSARKVHGDKYDYDKVKYIDAFTKVCIICKDHGEFWQVPTTHTKGSGCPKCNLSHLERDVMNYLDEHRITYDYQKRFDWLGKQSLDFYLPAYNVGIECQGGQHFFPVEHFGGDKGFKKTLERDKRKKKLCEKHGVKLLYFGNVPNYDTFLGETIHDDVQYLIDYLNEHKKK